MPKTLMMLKTLTNGSAGVPPTLVIPAQAGIHERESRFPGSAGVRGRDARPAGADRRTAAGGWHMAKRAGAKRAGAKRAGAKRVGRPAPGRPRPVRTRRSQVHNGRSVPARRD